MIVVHDNDYELFVCMLNQAVALLQSDAKNKEDYYLNRDGVNLEKDVFKYLKESSLNTLYENKIELISGQRFPDIVAYVNENKAYGLEVKTTKSGKWKSTGSSIFEGTRVSNVQNIHLLFAKLTRPIQFKCRKYEDCLYDVAITHSPRYLIDMDTKESESIFSKVGVPYNELRKLDNPFEPIKSYLRKGLKEGEDLWWIDKDDESVRDLSVKHWGNLDPTEKEEIMIAALAYFPVLFSNNPKKFIKVSTWLVSTFGVVNHALRDTFTAGGKIEINGIKFPKIFSHLRDHLGKIHEVVDGILEDDVCYYWEIEKPVNNKFEQWKAQCLTFCKPILDERQYLELIKTINS